jgi:hypothetical protein
MSWYERKSSISPLSFLPEPEIPVRHWVLKGYHLIIKRIIVNKGVDY